MFWLTHPPTEPQRALFNAVLKAHYESAQRDNASSVAVVNAAQASGDYTKSIAAALMTLGGKHAPLVETYDLITGPALPGGILPGWGNSFVKGGHDPLWTEVRESLFDHFPKLLQRIDRITEYLHLAEVRIYPNPSAYTAAAAIALECPRELCPFLFVAGRLEAWSQLFATQMGTQ